MRSLVLVAGLAGAAHAQAMTVTGDVTAATSRWTAGGDRIITEATIHTPTGDVVVSQLGGSVDGLTMRTFPGPEMLVPGMRVTVAAHPGLDLSQRAHIAVDDVKVLAMPPGYVQTGPTKAGKYLYWESGCVFLTVDAAGTKEIAGEAEFAVIDSAIQTWNTAATSCSYIKVMNQGRREVETGRDNVNIIKFRDQSWCRPASGDDMARCHPDSAAGITTATYVDDPTSDRDGAIVDADIELNGENFSIGTNGQSLGTSPCISDLQNTLTHELGHLLGLEHTCRAMGDPDRVDDQGRAVPSCVSTSDPVITEATMYNFQDCGEVKKATLEPDDVAGLCGIYPRANDPGSCIPVDDGTGCCQTGDSPRGSLLLSVLVSLGLMSFWRRRR
jgi:predicted Zn-dependent protease